MQKRMYKVLCPIERNGSTYWMRLGSAFGNRDESINVYLDAVPAASKEGSLKLQIRELTAEELRARAEKRASYATSRESGNGAQPAASAQGLPF